MGRWRRRSETYAWEEEECCTALEEHSQHCIWRILYVAYMGGGVLWREGGERCSL